MNHRSIFALTAVAAICFGAGCSSDDDNEGAAVSDAIALDTAITLTSRPYGVAVSGAGVVLVTRLDNASVARFALASRTLVEDSIAVGSIPTGIAFAPNGAKAFVASQGNTMDVINVATNAMTTQTALPGAGFNLAVTPNGSRVYVGTNVIKVYVVDATSYAIVDSIPSQNAPNWLTFSSNGATVWFSDASAGSTRHAPIPAHTPVSVTEHGGSFQGIVLSSNGAKGYVVNQAESRLYTFDTSTGIITDSMTVPGGSPFGMVRRPGSEYLWITTLTGWIVVIDPIAKTVTDSLEAGGTLRRLSFDPAGTAAVIADEDGRVLFAH